MDTRKITHGQDQKTFVETKYSHLLSESKSEREDSQLESSQKPESINS